jgi:Alkylmercury lyase
VPLEHLFDAELRYRRDAEPLVPVEGRAGRLVGSGEGVVEGARLVGALRWTLFEIPGDLVCVMEPVAVIETEDGARIDLEACGYARRSTVQGSRLEGGGDAAVRKRGRALPLDHRAARRLGRRVRRRRASCALPGLPANDGDVRPERIEQASTVDAAPESAAIPEWRRGRERLARLGEGERALYRWVVRSFATGRVPTADEFTNAAGRFGVSLDQALAVLAAEDLVHADGASGVMLVDYPFSATPRGHRVLIDGRQWVEAMCAIDALGIAAMLEGSIEVFSGDPVSGGEVWVRIDPGDGARWEPEHAVVLAGSSCRAGPSFQNCCSVLNFFESGENALQYVIAHRDVTGQPISLPEAIEAGRTVFGDLLKEDRDADLDRP